VGEIRRLATSFFEMLVKLEDRPARLAAVKARLAKNASTQEAGALKAFEEMLGADLGDTFVVKMAKNPTARKMLAATMVATGGGVICKKMYDSWMQGTAQEDLSDAAFALIDFVPGGMSLKRAATEGVDVQTTFMFAKEASTSPQPGRSFWRGTSPMSRWRWAPRSRPRTTMKDSSISSSTMASSMPGARFSV